MSRGCLEAGASKSMIQLVPATITWVDRWHNLTGWGQCTDHGFAERACHGHGALAWADQMTLPRPYTYPPSMRQSPENTAWAFNTWRHLNGCPLDLQHMKHASHLPHSQASMCHLATPAEASGPGGSMPGMPLTSGHPVSLGIRSQFAARYFSCK